MTSFFQAPPTVQHVAVVQAVDWHLCLWASHWSNLRQQLIFGPKWAGYHFSAGWWPLRLLTGIPAAKRWQQNTTMTATPWQSHCLQQAKMKSNSNWKGNPPPSTCDQEVPSIHSIYLKYGNEALHKDYSETSSTSGNCTDKNLKQPQTTYW